MSSTRIRATGVALLIAVSAGGGWLANSFLGSSGEIHEEHAGAASRDTHRGRRSVDSVRLKRARDDHANLHALKSRRDLRSSIGIFTSQIHLDDRRAVGRQANSMANDIGNGQ